MGVGGWRCFQRDVEGGGRSGPCSLQPSHFVPVARLDGSRLLPLPPAAQVWEEGVSSEAGAVRLYAADIVAALVSGLGSSQWSRKKTCAGAVVQLTEVRRGLIGLQNVDGEVGANRRLGSPQRSRKKTCAGAVVQLTEVRAGRGRPGKRAADSSHSSRPNPSALLSFPLHPQRLPRSWAPTC